MFKYNLHKRNADKCYCLGRSSNSISTKIRSFEIKKIATARNYFELNLMINLISTAISQTTSCKINPLARIAPYMDTTKRSN